MAGEDRNSVDAQIEAAMREIERNVEQEVRAERAEEAARKAAEEEAARIEREERIRAAEKAAEEARVKALTIEDAPEGPEFVEAAAKEAAADAVEEADGAVEAADQDAAEGAAPDEPVIADIAPHEEGLTTEQIVKSRRLRKRYIAAIVVLVILIVGIIGALVYNFLVPKDTDSAETAQTALVEQAAETGETAAVAKASTEVPNLLSMVGVTEADAVASLGSKAGEKTVTPVEAEVPEVEEGEEPPEVEELDSDIVSVERIDIVTEGDAVSKAEPAVYLTLRRDGYVQEVYYTCDLNLLGCELVTFEEMIADSEKLAGYLSAAGVTADATMFGEPDESNIETVMGKDKDGKDAPESKTYTIWDYADTGGEEGTWEIIVKYDYSAANKSGDATDVVRTIDIRMA